MLVLDVYDENGKVTGKVRFDETVLGEKVRRHLLQQVVVSYLANRRSGTACTKTRGERRGGGRKPWRQKGTGNARVGSRRSPLWRKGGITFGPRPRDFRQKISRNSRRAALKSALLSKFRDKEVTVIEPLQFESPKTKRVVGLLRALALDGKACLVALSEPDGTFWKSARNVPRLSVTTTRELNALEILRASRLIMTRPAIEKLGAALAAASAEATAPREAVSDG